MTQKKQNKQGQPYNLPTLLPRKRFQATEQEEERRGVGEIRQPSDSPLIMYQHWFIFVRNVWHLYKMLTIRTLCAQFFCKPETAQQSVCGRAVSSVARTKWGARG